MSINIEYLQDDDVILVQANSNLNIETVNHIVNDLEEKTKRKVIIASSDADLTILRQRPDVQFEGKRFKKDNILKG